MNELHVAAVREPLVRRVHHVVGPGVIGDVVKRLLFDGRDDVGRRESAIKNSADDLLSALNLARVEAEAAVSLSTCRIQNRRINQRNRHTRRESSLLAGARLREVGRRDIHIGVSQPVEIHPAYAAPPNFPLLAEFLQQLPASLTRTTEPELQVSSRDRGSVNEGEHPQGVLR
jgi:hypothetical protein